ncbi:MAG: cytochrome c biogenesis CcdA family protein [Paracoccaceae bacterium]
MDAALILDATLIPALAIAMVAGLLSFLSPCVLPIVPPYLAYMGGVQVSELGTRSSRRAVVASLFFVLGLSTVFLMLGFAFSALGRAFLAWQGWFVTGAGVVIMVFGTHFLGIFRLGFLMREARIDAKGDGTAFGAYLLGLAFAFGWTPCLGPILGAILGLAASGADTGRGTAMLAAYAVGLGVPFIAVAAFFPRLTGAMAWMRARMERIERISGLLLWTVGLMMVTGQFTAFSWWLLEAVPVLSTLG